MNCTLSKFYILLMIGVLSGFSQAWANPTGDASLHGGVIHSEQKDTTTLTQKAKMWRLSTEDYQLYLKEMRDSPSRYWWKDIDPPQVLGMNAKTEEERMKYARIDVRLDHDRVSREIAFQHAYSKAFKELYPHEKPIAIHTKSDGNDR